MKPFYMFWKKHGNLDFKLQDSSGKYYIFNVYNMLYIKVLERNPTLKGKLWMKIVIKSYMFYFI